MSIPEFDEIIEPNDQTEARLDHLNAMRELVGNVYPNKFNRSRLSGSEDSITAIKEHREVRDVEHEMAIVKENLAEGERPPSDIKDSFNERLKALGNARIAGRLTTPPRGNFVHLTDGISKLQIYCKKGQFALVKNDGVDTLDQENGWTAWGLIDHGDLIGVEGYLFVTNTGEVSVHVEKLQFLAKAMVPMPDKMHGIEDPEIKQRQRYVDLIGSSLAVRSEPPASVGGQELTTREVFERRAKIISSMRRFLEDDGYVEVETPMLTPKATGAAAKPFKTHHNALDIDLYARIAPELYLKRLVVGGFEKVYELNRNFRNEGISYKHNPEFTMLEFYCAYMDVNGMMDFCEAMLRESVRNATGALKVNYEEKEIDFGKFERVTMRDAVAHWFAQVLPSFQSNWLDDVRKLQALGAFSYHYQYGRDEHRSDPNRAFEQHLDFFLNNPSAPSVDRTESGEPVTRDQLVDGVTLQFFEDLVESTIIQPTFIVDYPKSISPLSKASPENPAVAERFELFINGMEVANGFSELNDPKEQYERFADQMQQREKGDEEAMILDEDYIRALSYGMPPAAGIGIGIDRLVMLLTNRHSIRDVILFPHMRPEKRDEETGRQGDKETEN